MTSNPASQAETLIERIIGVSSRNAFLVIILTFFGVAGGIYALIQIPLDAIPDQTRLSCTPIGKAGLQILWRHPQQQRRCRW
jgi:hypothetical protein